MTKWIISCMTLLMLLVSTSVAQKIGYVSTDFIRSQYQMARHAEGRLTTSVDEWKSDMAQKQRDIDELEVEIKKNRLIWSDQERQVKEKEIEDKRRERDQFARDKFEPGGEYDKLAEQAMQTVWAKIYAAIQKVSATDGYDIVWDKSVQPLVYVNAKYDITSKVMKELGIDAADLEAKQKEAIEGDPRNKRIEEPRKRKSRRTPAADTTQSPTPNPAQNPAAMPSNPSVPPVLPMTPNGVIPPGQMPVSNPGQGAPVPADTTKKPGGGR